MLPESKARVESALSAFARGDFVLVMDRSDRENECDLVIAAEFATEAKLAFMIRYSTGIVCVATDQERLEGFGLHPATARNSDVNATNFYVSTDFLPGTTTGVSAADRAATIRAFCDLQNPPSSFSKPGHVFPLCSKPKGVLERGGHTESTYDLCRLCGLTRAGVLAEMADDDGKMTSRADSIRFGQTHGLTFIDVDELVEYRRNGYAPQALPKVTRTTLEEVDSKYLRMIASASSRSPVVSLPAFHQMNAKLDTKSCVENALAAFARGEFVMVMDSADREDECDLILAAEHATAERLAFMIRYSTGIVCVAADQKRLESLGLHPATACNTDQNATNFYVATDYIPSTTTGVSASDRAATIRAFADERCPASSFSKPGHIFPLCARENGVLDRPGHTESTYDLCRLSGLTRVGVLAEMMGDDGRMCTREECLRFGREHRIPFITVEQLIEYRRNDLQRSEVPLKKAGVVKQMSMRGPNSVGGMRAML